MTGSFEILEHTADVGLRLTGSSPGEVFEAAGEGVATLLGAWFPGGGKEHLVETIAVDREALLAGWIDDLLYIHEAEDVVFCGFEVEVPDEVRLSARVLIAPRDDRELEGVGIKAATYHRLRFEQRSDGIWLAEIYVDV
ncbi:MAG TPA: archease [Actinomycetota bacterium]|nr:archease [Actinomycetota bacterium]